MKTIKDAEYSIYHTLDRLKERYGIYATESDYYTLCDKIKSKIDCTLINYEIQEGGIQETYRVLFNGYIIYAVWSTNLQRVKTVIPSPYYRED